jgi:hypothetical protein
VTAGAERQPIKVHSGADVTLPHGDGRGPEAEAALADMCGSVIQRGRGATLGLVPEPVPHRPRPRI